MMVNRILFLLSLLAVVSACDLYKESELRKIDLEKSFKEGDDSFFKIDDLTANVEYVQLETNDSSLIGQNMEVYVSEDEILTITNRQVFLFDRKNGNFIREVACYGEGPGNYTRVNSIHPFDEKEKTITLFENNKKLTFSLDGNIKNTTIQPAGFYETIEVAPSVFAGFIPNFSGKDENKIALFDENGVVLGAFVNYNQAVTTDDRINFWKPNGWFYKNQNQTYFYELFTDTVFHISPSALLPHFILYQGKYLPPYNKKNTSFDIADYFMMKKLHESDKYIFYTFSYQESIYMMVHDKKGEQTKVYNNSITPFTFSNINSDNELVGFVESYDFEKWESVNPLTAQQKMKLKQINETDNPIIVIGKLKTK